MRAGAYQRASVELERAIQLDGKYLLAHARLAEAWLELDFLDRMREELLAVSEIEREFGRDSLEKLDALYVNAVTSTARREYAAAAASYDEIARLNDRRPETHFDAGRAHEKNNNTAERHRQLPAGDGGRQALRARLPAPRDALRAAER